MLVCSQQQIDTNIFKYYGQSESLSLLENISLSILLLQKANKSQYVVGIAKGYITIAKNDKNINQNALNQMSFVAQKLGFLRCNNENVIQTSSGKRVNLLSSEFVDQSLVRKKRKLSNQEESSESSSLSLGKLKLTESSDSDPNDNQRISIPIAIRPKLQTKSVLTIPQLQNYSSFLPQFSMSMLEGMSEPPIGIQFPASQYLSFLIAPYGTPTKFIGPITAAERKTKVDRYLQKKKNRHWKNVKYTVRQQLAESRKRTHGRFVKSQRKWRWNQIPIKVNQGEIKESGVGEGGKKQQDSIDK